MTTAKVLFSFNSCAIPQRIQLAWSLKKWAILTAKAPFVISMDLPDEVARKHCEGMISDGWRPVVNGNTTDLYPPQEKGTE